MLLWTVLKHPSAKLFVLTIHTCNAIRISFNFNFWSTKIFPKTVEGSPFPQFLWVFAKFFRKGFYFFSTRELIQTVFLNWIFLPKILKTLKIDHKSQTKKSKLKFYCTLMLLMLGFFPMTCVNYNTVEMRYQLNHQGIYQENPKAIYVNRFLQWRYLQGVNLT